MKIRERNKAVKFNESCFDINMEVKEADFPIDTQMQESEDKEEMTEEQMQEAVLKESWAASIIKQQVWLQKM